ncbi:MAG: putative DNA-binding domain-containing protein [Myxococcales bacterium]|nr:putative DNA-binding domain-containing protein [Myxococcales bacterium]
MTDRKPSPLLGGATEAFVHERASATPRNAVLEAAPAAHGTSTRPPVVASFDRLQSWFAASVTHAGLLSEGVVADGLVSRLDELERVVTRGPRLGALERLGVYHHGYRARLVECLADDYPAVQYALGTDTFEALCHGYIARHPSRSPNLNAYGQHMSAFLVEGASGVDLGTAPLAFLAGLATLEWALVEVLHAAAAPVLSLETLQSTPPDAWPSARLPRADTVRLLRLAYPVNAYFQAWRTDEAPTIPTAAASATVVYRHELTLWRLDLTPAMTALLSALFGGETLGDALAHIEREVHDAEELAEAERSVMIWFREWVAGGVFARIELPDANLEGACP